MNKRIVFLKNSLTIGVIFLFIGVSFFPVSGILVYNFNSDSEKINIKEDFNYKGNFVEGWPVTLETEGILASPVPYDFNNDGKNEIVIATYGPPDDPYGPGKVYVINSNGTVASGWPVVLSDPAPSTPAVGDLNNDGISEIIAADWNYIYMLHFDGSIAWKKRHSYDISGPSSPVLTDLDGDNSLDIILCAKGGNVFAWSYNGVDIPGWPITINESLWHHPSTPAVCDLDKDGNIEIVINTEDDYTYVFNHDGTVSDGWPVLIPDDPEWYTNICRPPAIADLDGDNDFEIVRDGGTNLYVFEHDGSIASGWPQNIQYNINNAFCLGDLDCDNLPEIVFGRSGEGYWNNYLYAFNGDGSSVSGWPINVGTNFICTTCVMGDVDSSLPPEIITRHENKIYIFNADGSIMSGWPKYLDDAAHSGTIQPCPLITDLDDDGYIEIIAPSFYNSIYKWNLSGVYDVYSVEWPMYQHDPLNTGFFDNKPPVKPRVSGPTDGNPGNEYSYTIVTTDPDGDDIAYYIIDWGDTNIDIVEGPFKSGKDIVVNHKWSKHGTYGIRAKGKDINNAESSWSEKLSVIIPRNKFVYNSFFLRFLELYPLPKILLSLIKII
jgi:hypothetical protein